ncbi:MAG: glycosyltransferase [Candidatus Eisenbacteria bacterium]|nr:glycosyltransferase [Candidatus Eisenbacteria bacterium]
MNPTPFNPGPPESAAPRAGVRPAAAPRFSVILPTRNRKLPLLRALASLESQSLPRETYEIIVVDDGCVDGTAAALEARARAGGLSVARTPGLGPAAARNAGLALARGRILAFTDDDCEVPREWLERLADALGPGGADAVGGSARNGLPSALAGVYQDMAGHFYRVHNREPGRARFLTTNNFACRRRALDAVGGFDERFRLGGSDREMAQRMVERGLRVDYRPELTVMHFHHFRLLTFLRHLYLQGKGSHLYRRVIARERPSPAGGLGVAGYARMLAGVARGHGWRGGALRVGLALLGQAAVLAGFAVAAAQSPGSGKNIERARA